MYKILIVDDESLERKALRCIIRDNIPQITLFEEGVDGQDGIEKAREFSPHIIIMDIKMPRIDGIEASRLIKEFLPGCRIILLSGYTYFSYAREAVSIGIEDFLVKPIGDEDLIESVQNVVDQLEEEKNRSQARSEEDKQIKDLYNCLEEDFVSSLVSRQVEEPHLSRFLTALDLKDFLFLGIIIKGTKDLPFKPERVRRMREAANIAFERDRVITVALENRVYMLLTLKEYRANLILKKQFKQFLSLLDDGTAPLPAIHGGTIKRHPEEISESFNEARMVPLTEEKTGFFQIPLSPLDEQFPINVEEELCECLVRGEQEEALGLLCSLYQWIESNSRDFENLMMRSYELLVVLNRRVRRELDPGDSTAYYEQLSALETQEEVKAYLIKTVRNLHERISRHYSSSVKVWKKHITRYIEENYRKTIALEELAEIAGFSAPYLSRIFKKEFGMSFTSYVNHLRIRDAKDMLNDPNLSIKEISYQLGFSDSNYFARVFKKETGINASQYKKSPTVTK
ncbi:MAG: response regulator [Spirochaetales bacterium]|nr:response regulator [Spirochaetales bacterium]